MNISDKVVKINELLKRTTVQIPPFRKTVTESGRNVQWLVKALKNNDDVSSELINLLNTFWHK
jgi:hypothetical protein